MADPAYNGGGLIGFDSTTTGGNTNSGNNNSTPNPPKSSGPPFPIPPPKENTPPPPKPQESILDEVSSVSKPIKPSPKPVSLNLRESLDDDEIVKQVVGDFSQNGSIRLSGQYPQNYVDIPTYDLSKLNIVSDPDVDFNFVLCLKNGQDSIPKLFVTKRFYVTLTSNYANNRPFGVNDIIEEKNIVVIDIEPIKQKVESLRIEELNTDIDLTSVQESERKYVEVLRNLFVHSNYSKNDLNRLEANPTYTDIELLRYISWVVAKPSNNFDERLIPAELLGDYKDFPENDTPASDEPSNQIDNGSDDDGNPAETTSNSYPPIGRSGVEDEEEVYFNGKTWVWNEDDEVWEILDVNTGEPLPPNNGNNGSGNTGGGGPGGNDPRDRS